MLRPRRESPETKATLCVLSVVAAVAALGSGLTQLSEDKWKPRIMADIPGVRGAQQHHQNSSAGERRRRSCHRCPRGSLATGLRGWPKGLELSQAVRFDVQPYPRPHKHRRACAHLRGAGCQELPQQQQG